MHARHDAPDTRRSVVYLQSAPSLAFPDVESQRATLDQRNETFVPHVLAITVGTTVDFPNSDNIYHNVFSLRNPRFDLGRYAAGRRNRSVSTVLSSSACSESTPMMLSSSFSTIATSRHMPTPVQIGGSARAIRWSHGTKGRFASRVRSSSRRVAAPSKRISPCDSCVTILGSLTNRIFLASAALAVVSIAAAVYFVSRTATREAEAELQRGLIEAGALVDEQCATLVRTLTLMARLVANDPRLKAAVDTVTRRRSAAAARISSTAEHRAVRADRRMGPYWPGVGRRYRRKARSGRCRKFSNACGAKSSGFWPQDRRILQVMTVTVAIGIDRPDIVGASPSGSGWITTWRRNSSAPPKATSHSLSTDMSVASTLQPKDRVQLTRYPPAEACRRCC